jgi:hypothetical protein
MTIPVLVFSNAELTGEAMSLMSRIFGKPNTESNQLTPFEVGIVLAGSLIEGSTANSVSSEEAELLASATISHQAFVEERFLLNASAAAFAIDSHIAVGEIKSQVSAGFKSWFLGNAARSPQAAKVNSVFEKRMPLYFAAARNDSSQSSAGLPGISLNEVDFVFGDCLLEHALIDPSSEGACRVIAMVFGQAFWLSRLEVSIALLRQSKLVA